MKRTLSTAAVAALMGLTASANQGFDRHGPIMSDKLFNLANDFPTRRFFAKEIAGNRDRNHHQRR